jgi:hypothetical protein
MASVASRDRVWPYSFENLCETDRGGRGFPAQADRAGAGLVDVTVQRSGPACENMNHRRRDAPVSHCSECGGVVNAGLRATDCDGSRHDLARRQGRTFCVDCGVRLIAAR